MTAASPTIDRPRGDAWNEVLAGWKETATGGGVRMFTPPGENHAIAYLTGQGIHFTRGWGDFAQGDYQLETAAALLGVEAASPAEERRPLLTALPRDPAHEGRARETASTRTLELTPASKIKPRPVFWLWEGRLALGTLGLIAGREGIGKSTTAYWLAARVTRGELPGEGAGKPRGVLIAATEDSWEHTIVPRLIAADADLDRVFRVEVRTADDIHVGMSLPHDLHALEQAAAHADAALLLLDPLMSRLGDLDTHKDAEVRIALEPLVAIADRASMTVVGLIHHNKSASADPLQLVMGSKAFTAVARSVHTVVVDPDDESEQRRLFGTPKNNLGRSDLNTLSFTIQSTSIPTDEGPAWTGRVVWGAEVAESISTVMQRAGDTDRTATAEAADWLRDVLSFGRVASAEVKRDAAKAGHAANTLDRARKRLNVVVSSEGFPRRTYWHLPGPLSVQSSHPVTPPSQGREITGMNGDDWEKVPPVTPVIPVDDEPTRASATGA